MKEIEKQIDMNAGWENLGISNDFLFGKVMQNPELCKELLQRILPELEIDRIEYPELQKGINLDADAKSVRLEGIFIPLKISAKKTKIFHWGMKQQKYS